MRGKREMRRKPRWLLFAALLNFAIMAVVTSCPAASNTAAYEPVVEAPVYVEQLVFEEGTTPARTAQYININMTDDERDELAKIVFLEARGESAAGQQAIVEVVFNRVLSPDFPGTVHDVLHDGEGTKTEQFSTIGYVDQALPSEDQYAAIDAALYGETILPLDVVFFSQNGENADVWGEIGRHIFCRAYSW